MPIRSLLSIWMPNQIRIREKHGIALQLVEIDMDTDPDPQPLDTDSSAKNDVDPIVSRSETL